MSAPNDTRPAEWRIIKRNLTAIALREEMDLCTKEVEKLADAVIEALPELGAPMPISKVRIAAAARTLLISPLTPAVEAAMAKAQAEGGDVVRIMAAGLHAFAAEGEER